jgi:hypothetical protein
MGLTVLFILRGTGVSQVTLGDPCLAQARLGFGAASSCAPRPCVFNKDPERQSRSKGNTFIFLWLIFLFQDPFTTHINTPGLRGKVMGLKVVATCPNLVSASWTHPKETLVSINSDVGSGLRTRLFAWMGLKIRYHIHRNVARSTAAGNWTTYQTICQDGAQTNVANLQKRHPKHGHREKKWESCSS